MDRKQVKATQRPQTVGELDAEIARLHRQCLAETGKEPPRPFMLGDCVLPEARQ